MVKLLINTYTYMFIIEICYLQLGSLTKLDIYNIMADGKQGFAVYHCGLVILETYAGHFSSFQ